MVIIVQNWSLNMQTKGLTWMPKIIMEILHWWLLSTEDTMKLFKWSNLNYPLSNYKTRLNEDYDLVLKKAKKEIDKRDLEPKPSTPNLAGKPADNVSKLIWEVKFKSFSLKIILWWCTAIFVLHSILLSHFSTFFF